MRRKMLGNTCLEVSEIGWTAARLGVDSNIPEDRMFAILERALALGVQYWDTAPLFGRSQTESLVGRFLANLDTSEQPVVASRVGWGPDGFDFSYAATMHTLDASLKRLGLEQLPLVQIQDIEVVPLEVIMGPKGAFAALRRLQVEGVVGHIGVTGGAPEHLAGALETREFEAVLTHHRYNLLDSSATALIDQAAALGIGVIHGAPFGTGLLAGGTDASGGGLPEDIPDDVRARVATMRSFFAAHGVELGEAALVYSLTNPNIAVTIVGAASEQELEDRVAVTELDRADLQGILENWRNEEQELATGEHSRGA